MKWLNADLETYLVIGGVGLCIVLGFDNAAGWHDTSEFASVGRLLTTSHSPGHPLYSALSAGWTTLVPFGTVAFRVACFSGFCCLVSLITLLRCLAEIGADRRLGLYWLSGGILSPPLMSQSVRPEVYALTVLLTSLVVLFWLKWWRTRDERYVLTLGFIVGLGGASHSYLALIPLPMVLASFLYQRVSILTLFMSGMAGILGLLTYVWLPIRADRGEIGWGVPDTLESFWRMVSAQEWTKSLAPEGLNAADQIIETCVAFIEWLGPVGFCVWFIALAISFTRAVLRRNVIALFLFGLAASFLLFRGLIDVDIHNPDLMGYLAPGFMIAMLAQSSAVSDLPLQMVRLPMIAGIVFCTSMVLTLQLPDGENSADRYAQQLLAEAPIDGVLLTSNYSSWFWTWYLRGIEGQRPDVRVVFRGRLGESWQTHRLEMNFPDIGKRIRMYPEAFAASDTVWEPGVLLPEHIGQIPLQPKGLTFSVGTSAEPQSIKARYNSVFRSEHDTDRRQEAFRRYESLRLMKRLVLDQNYLDIHRASLTKLGGADPLVQALLRSTEPIEVHRKN